MNKKRYIKVPPELVDGESWTLWGLNDPGTDLSVIIDWARDDAEIGDTLTFEIVEMTDEEVEALPEL